MVDFNTCRASKAGNIITPKCRLSYAHILEPNPDPKAVTKSGKKKYTVSLLIPPNADITLLKKAAGDAAVEEFGAEKVKQLREMERFNVPFLDAFAKSRTEKNPAGDEQFKGWTLIRASSVQKPGVVNAKGENVDDSAEVYSGRWACVSLRPFAYAAAKGGNSGVSFGVQNLQLLDHDTPLGGGGVRAEDEFEAVEGSLDDAGEPSGGATSDSVFD